MTRILCLAVLFFAVTPVSAADVIGAMRPTADLAVYFDTQQAERDMTPELWKQIQADKQKARVRSGRKKTFNTDGRDVVGCVNVDFLGFDPFRFRLDGLLNVSGGKNASAKQDVRDFAVAFREMGYEVVDGGDKRHPSCKVNMSANDPLPDSGAELVSEDDGTLRLKARWGLKETEEAPTSGKEARLAEILSGQAVSGSSLVAVGDARTLSRLPLDGNEAQRALKQLLLKLEVFRLNVRVHGDALTVLVKLLFKSDKEAAACRKDASSGSPAFLDKSSSGMLRNFASGGEGKTLTVSFDVDVRTAWAFLGRFNIQGGKTSGGKRLKR